MSHVYIRQNMVRACRCILGYRKMHKIYSRTFVVYNVVYNCIPKWDHQGEHPKGRVVQGLLVINLKCLSGHCG